MSALGRVVSRRHRHVMHRHAADRASRPARPPLRANHFFLTTLFLPTQQWYLFHYILSDVYCHLHPPISPALPVRYNCQFGSELTLSAHPLKVRSKLHLLAPTHPLLHVSVTTSTHPLLSMSTSRSCSSMNILSPFFVRFPNTSYPRRSASINHCTFLRLASPSFVHPPSTIEYNSCISP